MATLCAAQCANPDLIPNPTAGCEDVVRYKTLSRIHFALCATELPEPMECAAIKALYTANQIVRSSILGNIVVGDVQREDLLIDECSVPFRRIVARELTFEDRIAIEFAGGSPDAYDDYWDYYFWLDKLNNRNQLRYFLEFCDGDVIIPRDVNGNLLTANLIAELSYQKPTTQGAGWVEFKKASLMFNGDFLYFQVPDFNVYTCEIG